MDDRRIDLSALDPARDARRFEHMVQAVLAASAARAPMPRHPVETAMVARGRVAVAMALLLAAGAWVPVLASRRGAAPEARSQDAVALVTAWADEGAIPASADVFHVLGADDAR